MKIKLIKILKKKNSSSFIINSQLTLTAKQQKNETIYDENMSHFY